MTRERLGGPFHEGLAQEFRTLQAPVDPDLFPAALGHRGNTHVLLQFISTPEPFPLLTEGEPAGVGRAARRHPNHSPFLRMIVR
jgi:hypothetical protein